MSDPKETVVDHGDPYSLRGAFDASDDTRSAFRGGVPAGDAMVRRPTGRPTEYKDADLTNKADALNREKFFRD